MTPTSNGSPQKNFFLFLLVMSVFTAAMIFVLYKDWRVNHLFIQTQCTILNKKFDSRYDHQTKKYSSSFNLFYQAGGEQFTVWHSAGIFKEESAQPSALKIYNRYEVGHRYPCWYDPNSPNIVVLERGYELLVWVLGGLVLLLIIAAVQLFKQSYKNIGNQATRD